MTNGKKFVPADEVIQSMDKMKRPFCNFYVGE